MSDEIPQLSYERLDVYRCSIEFVVLVAPLLETLPRGNAALADQLKRASMSVPLNVAEAAGKTSRADRSRYYATARGSAMECAAIIDVCRALGVLDDALGNQAKGLLVRVVAVLTKLCR